MQSQRFLVRKFFLSGSCKALMISLTIAFQAVLLTCTSLADDCATVAHAHIPPLRWHRMAYDSDRNRVVLYGGNAAAFSLGSKWVSETWEWDGSMWLLHAEDGPDPSAVSGMAYDSLRHRIILTMGYTTRGETWSWDGLVWTLLTTVSPVQGPEAALVYDSVRDRMVLYGGRVASSGYTSDTWEFDGTTWFKAANTGPTPRGRAAMCFDALRGRVLLFGGSPSSGAPLGDTWEWDGSVWNFRASTGPAARESAVMAADPQTHRIFLYGGKTGFDLLKNDTWEWDGAVWGQRQTSGLQSRYAAAMVPDPFGGLLLYGGSPDESYSHDTALGDTWNWNGTTWREIDSQPRRRSSPAIAFDSTRHQVVLFGGYGSREGSTDSVYLNDTWVFGNGSWERRAAGPLLRAAAGATYDKTRDRVVIFGGRATSGLLGDTCEWDGVVWRRVALTGPTARSDAAMVFEEKNARTILFGGSSDTSETWAWDGTNWTQVAISGPPPRRDMEMVYDRARGVVVLSGGRTSNGNLREDTWEWDGATWVERQTNGSPCADGGQLRYDETLDAVVCVTEDTINGGNLNTFVWNGKEWVKQASIHAYPDFTELWLGWDSERRTSVGIDSNYGEVWDFGLTLVLKQHPPTFKSDCVKLRNFM